MVKINFMGDVMFAELLENYRRGLKTVIGKRGIDPFEHVRPVLKEADLNVINLECVFSDSSILQKPFSEILISPERFVRFLVDNRINVVTTANNHALDHGREQFERSVGILISNGISVIGYDIGRFFQEDPVVVEAGERKIGFLGYNISNFPEPDKRKYIEKVKKIIPGARRSVDTLVVSIHWGEEYTNIPPPYVVEFGKELIAAGVDILHGHHSHQIQGVIKDGNRIFAPSLGNFIFDQKVDRNRVTAVLQVQIDGDGELAFRYIPFYMNDLFQPEPAPQYEGYIEEINGYLADCYQEGRTATYADIVESNVRNGHRDNRVRMRIGMLTHFLDYLPYASRILSFKIKKENPFSVINSDKCMDSDKRDESIQD